MLNESCLVSVIVPIYNVGKYVSKCIQSICEQTYSNIEIVLVDDGSTDNSGAICDEYKKKDTRIKVIHKKNAGVSSARNTGITKSTGDYICFVDGDDYVMPDYVEYMLGQITENKADIALTTQMFGNFDEKQVKNDKIEIWNGEEAVEAILCYQVPMDAIANCLEQNFLEGVCFIPEIFIGEGFNFNVEAFQKANKVVAGKIRKIYYYRRDNPTSAMTKFSIKKCECGLWALEVIKQNLTIRSDRILEAWKYANWRTQFKEVAAIRGDAILLIVGIGPDEGKIKSRVKEHPYRDRIILYGETDNPTALYSAMDIFVFPSRYEGLPVVLLEAQISGLPCVVSDKVTREVDLGDINWQSIDDDPKQWAKAVVEIRRQSNQERLFYKEKHLSQIRKYNIACSVKQLDKIYTNMITKDNCDLL